ncbi:hypothetical protein UY3_05503 [Chelonia mydas]|uniref:Uncharacterized protein n=1 Tax=Chelonia mydas TaxID=8469 RepID=M7BJG0_CHEMY|nr:hypothetical protein UY3_05503 [Chelonia mydas]
MGLFIVEGGVQDLLLHGSRCLLTLALIGIQLDGEVSGIENEDVCNRVTKEIEVFSDWFLNVMVLDV